MCTIYKERNKCKNLDLYLKQENKEMRHINIVIDETVGEYILQLERIQAIDFQQHRLEVIRGYTKYDKIDDPFI